ncbi:MAG TPA: IS110 family transposase [Chitinophagaceae bacterium]|nr:IS110 family transposase [Chitinophagaceae bacterium]
MQINNFVGIDVSKKTLDFCLVQNGSKVLSITIANVPSEIKKCVSEFLKHSPGGLKETVFCMEHTGVYNLPLVKHLQGIGANIWLESGLQIKKSMGIARGKNDQIDAYRIAIYAFDKRYQMKLWKAPREIVEKLTAYLAQRSRLVKIQKLLKVPVKEQKLYYGKEQAKTVQRNAEPVLRSVIKQLKEIEKEIMKLIGSDERLAKLYKYVSSVKGVGFVTAVHIIVSTNEFISISEPKKFACYAGVVPFEHSSGTSVRGKTRVSKLANKNIKTLLHLSALTAIRKDGDLHEYYNRKLAEGKNKMSVINAIRNKIVLRIFACVRNEKKYEKNFQYNVN